MTVVAIVIIIVIAAAALATVCFVIYRMEPDMWELANPVALLLDARKDGHKSTYDKERTGK